MSQIIEWINAEELSKNPEVHSRNLFARKNHTQHPSDIVRKYTNLTLDELKIFLEYVLQDVGVELKGVGVELGAGVGGISNSLLALYPSIEIIYAIEIVPDVTKLLQSKVTEYAGNIQRLVPVIGSFDDIKLPDASVDFIVEFDSLHHSNNLNKTLREAARILKPGGVIIALDRMHFNGLTDAQREYMLHIEYGEAFKTEYGIPLEKKLTRGDNGEHEIRESEWKSAFEQAQLKIVHCVTFHRKCLRGIVFGLISQIPFSIRARYRFYPMVCQFPISFFLFYCLPFLPTVWNKKFRHLKLPFFRREIFLSKTIIVSSKETN